MFEFDEKPNQGSLTYQSSNNSESTLTMFFVFNFKQTPNQRSPWIQPKKKLGNGWAMWWELIWPRLSHNIFAFTQLVFEVRWLAFVSLVGVFVLIVDDSNNLVQILDL